MQARLRVALAYKSFALNRAVSHFGLGVTAVNNAKMLRESGICADVWPVADAQDLRRRLEADIRAGTPVSHVVMSAPWMQSAQWAALAQKFPDTRFAVTCHSNLGFLQADPSAMRLVREGIEVERASWNFHVAGNSLRFAKWVRKSYNAPCAYLPNLYYLHVAAPPAAAFYGGGTLRIGAFGATRPLKNLVSAAGAALQISSEMRTSVEFWISAGRNEGGGATLGAVREMCHGAPHFKLVENGWQPWPQFRTTIRHMHLLLQPSYTETFNVVTADGVAEGVPSVVSDAIDWAPPEWRAKVDHVSDIARVGRELLKDRKAAARGWRALQKHNANGLAEWREFLGAAHRPWWKLLPR